MTSGVLEWFRSYVCGRVQRVNIDECIVQPHPLTNGISQGSAHDFTRLQILQSPLQDVYC